ncbi:Crp/Fnr family transcriptional regulator [Thiohalobacter sp. IOR34]|uniref:Crp/Fnr family transcriptional regulator n=1 Tax=Thiohalobacter sp. IOR34 TaxID=3057176 RepID=UPI0025B0583A|nr:Crp/Fnr family transcriptional regulator [Thiohalobacter sp. IOR34]WJW75332.1 Crp/Fnr family transcriptional regulator [Thiohalobacter sp. IOR34]
MKLTDELRQRMRRTYLFSAFDDRELERVFATAHEIHLEEGENLFEYGQEADRFFLLLEGQVKLYRLSEEGDEKVIELIKPGHTFAEAVMFLSAKVYPVSVDAVLPSRLLSFSNQTFLATLHDSVDVCLRMMANMSQRLHRHLNEIDSLTLHNATYRLVNYLLNELPDDGQDAVEIMLSTPKHVIASRLSIKPETFSRILTRLSRDGLLTVHGTSIVLNDVEGLRELVTI